MPIRYNKIIDVWYIHSVTQDEKREILSAIYMLGCSHQYKWKWIMFQKRTPDIFLFFLFLKGEEWGGGASLPVQLLSLASTPFMHLIV